MVPVRHLRSVILTTGYMERPTKPSIPPCFLPPQLIKPFEPSRAQLLGWDRRKVDVYASSGQFPATRGPPCRGEVWRRADIEEYRARRLKEMAATAKPGVEGH
jgi:hypothetical protein